MNLGIMSGSKQYGLSAKRRAPRRRLSRRAARRFVSHPDPFPWGLPLLTYLQRISPNPEGIAPSSPGLRGTSYPGTTAAIRHNPNGIASASHDRSHNPVGVAARPTVFFQGSACRATLGFGPEYLWDSRSVPSKMWVIISPWGEGDQGDHSLPKEQFTAT